MLLINFLMYIDHFKEYYSSSFLDYDYAIFNFPQILSDSSLTVPNLKSFMPHLPWRGHSSHVLFISCHSVETYSKDCLLLR